MSTVYKSYLDALISGGKTTPNKDIVVKKILVVEQPDKFKVSLDDLPDDVIGEVLKSLPEKDFISIGSMSKRYYEGWLNKHRSDQCGQDTREALDNCIEDAMAMFDADRVPSRFERDGKPTDGLWITYERLKCTREGVAHDIRCEFIKFSRDVDILTCYIDGQCVSRYMM